MAFIKKLFFCVGILASVFIIMLFVIQPNDDKSSMAAKSSTNEKEVTKSEIKVVNDEKIKCDKFNLVSKLNGNTLSLNLDTDLHDEAEIMVTVSRTYTEKGNATLYEVDYFHEKSNIKKWKEKQNIKIDNKEWKKGLKVKQAKMEKLGLGFKVDTISKNIDVRIVVPIIQSDERFQIENLTGNAIKDSKNIEGMRLIEDGIIIPHPL